MGQNGIPQSAPAQSHKATSTKKCQNDDQTPSKCIKFLVNLLIYATCILSLSISVYLSYRHQQLESNVKSLMYLDKRVMRIEYDLDELIRTTQTTINANDRSDTKDESDESTVSKLPVQVYSEITRLKRDVSNLKTARRQRQTAIQQSPNENCMCPAGESLIGERNRVENFPSIIAQRFTGKNENFFTFFLSPFQEKDYENKFF
jgi:flagellar motor switch/type III secretory pathway protein FliN